MQANIQRWAVRGAVVAGLLVVVGVIAWQRLQSGATTEVVASGNGRLEAVEVDIATKLPGRILEILVDEGDWVEAGQVVARMDTTALQAQHTQAQALLKQTETAEATAKAIVAQRQSERAAVQATLAQRQAERDLAARRFRRATELLDQRALSQQDYEEMQAQLQGADAAIVAMRAQIAATESAIAAARSQVIQARSEIEAARATVAQVQADLDDAQLEAPRSGRIQYRLAQPGEVLGAGGKLLNMVDLSQVFMSFFLPETLAGRVAIGSEVRLVLDAAPEFAFPARVSYVASVAQFTPKTVETYSERQKLMFRVKARVDPELLRRYTSQVKPGLPGTAYVRIDSRAQWPEQLQVRLP